MPDFGPLENDERYVFIEHSIIRLADGSLLAAGQGVFRGSPNSRIRAFVIRSMDRGKTWSFVTTVAFDLRRALRGEGFDELNLLQISPGHILGFLRSGSGAGNPLYLTESVDNGNTWSHADPIADHGVYPNSWLMKNGVVALVFGRPGVNLMLSLDQGETWSEKSVIYQGPGSCDCWYYSSVAEIAPKTLMVVYHRSDGLDCMQSEVVGTIFHLR
jgi:photosystem II stability/assembly factor-like uncharacterized protein